MSHKKLSVKLLPDHTGGGSSNDAGDNYIEPQVLPLTTSQEIIYALGLNDIKNCITFGICPTGVKQDMFFGVVLSWVPFSKIKVISTGVWNSLKIIRFRFGWHTAHHNFKRGFLKGSRPHFQLNTWRKGVSKSDKAYRIPLPKNWTPPKK
jgi:hypothetical protein